MLEKRRGLLLFVAGLVILTQFLFMFPQAADASYTRLAGSDRYRTAVAVSQEGWESSEYAILVRGDDFADALCAGPLASKYNAPILFSDKYSLNKYTLEELERLEVEKVIIIGGRGVISGFVEDKLEAAGIDDIERIYGADRYATSVEIAKRLGSEEIAIANASHYADALSISAIAAAKDFSILLTRADSLPEVVREHLENYRIRRTYLIGGTNVISKEIERQVRAPLRLAGNDRFATNIKVLERFAEDLDFSKIYAATGEGQDSYADALAGVALAWRTSSPILLSAKNLPEVTKAFIEDNATIATQIIALGGSQAVPYSVINDLRESVDRVSKSVFSQEGTYGPAEGTTTISGNLVIDEDGITVRNTVIEGDLLLDEGIGNGTVELDNVTVEGRTTIRGGGDDSIIGKDFSGTLVVIDSDPERETAFTLLGKSRVEEVRVETDATLDASEVDGTAFLDVKIIDGDEVTLKGSFTTVSTKAIDVELRMRDATVKTLNVQAPAHIYGNGTVSTANISCDGVTITFSPAVTVVSQGFEAYVGGEWLEEGTNKYIPPPPPEPVPISNLQATPGNGQVSFTFSAPKDATSVTMKQSTDGIKWANAAAGTLKESSTSATVTGLTNGKKYYFRLVVVGGTRAGTSNTVEVTPSYPIDDLDAVAGDGQVSLSFSEPTGATKVDLLLSANDGSTWEEAETDSALTSSSTSALVTDLTNAQEYKFKLVVTGGARAGESNTVTVTPMAP